MSRPTPPGSSRGAVRVTWLWVAAIFILVLGIALMIFAVSRQPPLVERTEVLPAPTIAVPAMPAGVPAPGQLAMPQGGPYPAMPRQPGVGTLPQSMPSMPGGMPAGMPPGMAPPGGLPMPAVPTSTVPPPTPTPPIAETIECQEGLTFKVDPDEAVVTINDEVIGRAKKWSHKKEFEFPGPGLYYVRISSPGYKNYWFKVNVRPDAEKKTTKIKVELSKIDD